jgi:hypothetical protein
MKHFAALAGHAAVCVLLLAFVRNPLWLLAGVAFSATIFYLSAPARNAFLGNRGRLSDKLAGPSTVSNNQHFQMHLDGDDFSNKSNRFSFADHQRTWILALSAFACIVALLLKL